LIFEYLFHVVVAAAAADVEKEGLKNYNCEKQYNDS